MALTAVCGYCGHTFKLTHNKTQTFCNHACRKAYTRAKHTKHCPTCRQMFVDNENIYCSNTCRGIASRVSARKGHRDGYVLIRVAGTWLKEHRYVMEQHLNRKLLPSEHVHHKNRDRKDNRVENLEVLPARIHLAMHAKMRWTTDSSARAYRA